MGDAVAGGVCPVWFFSRPEAYRRLVGEAPPAPRRFHAPPRRADAFGAVVDAPGRWALRNGFGHRTVQGQNNCALTLGWCALSRPSAVAALPSLWPRPELVVVVGIFTSSRLIPPLVPMTSCSPAAPGDGAMLQGRRRPAHRRYGRVRLRPCTTTAPVHQAGAQLTVAAHRGPSAGPSSAHQ